MDAEILTRLQDAPRRLTSGGGPFKARVFVNEEDLRVALARIAALEAALRKIAYLRPGGPTRNNMIEQMERIALDALS